jgi:hypothetical protein
MQGPTEEAFIPTNYAMNGRVMGGTLRRKVATRTKPWLLRVAAAEPPALPPHPPPPPEDEDLPPAKRARLQARTSISTTADGVVHAQTAERVTTDSPDDTPTYSVTLTASLLSAATSQVPRRSWTPEEDAKLTEAVKKHGNHWVAVAAMVPGRKKGQCRQRWINTLDPANVMKGQWTPEEDAKLTEAVKKHGKYCAAAAAMVPGRTKGQCRQRWINTLDPANVMKGQWTPEEDAKLMEAVKKHGKYCVAVAVMVPGRTPVQCRERWTKNLDPPNGKKAGQWTPEEDSNLIEAVKKHGNHWVAVAAMVPSRTNDQCRQRWIYTLDPANVTKGQWTPKEDAKLTKAVKKHGKYCVAVAAMVPGRTDPQCRERWIYKVDPANGKNAGKWTAAEDSNLIEAVKKHGNHWVAVAALVPGRTNKRCRVRWVYSLNPDRASNTVMEEHNAGNAETLDSVPL